MTVSKLWVQNEDAGSSFILGFVKFPPHCMTSNFRRHYASLPPTKVLQSTNSIRGGPKIRRFFLIVYFSEHFQNVITLKILSLRINAIIPPLFPLFITVLELLQSESLQCLRRYFPHLLYILKTLSFKVPLHSWKQEKIARCQVQGVGGCKAIVIPFFMRNCRTLNAVWVGVLS